MSKDAQLFMQWYNIWNSENTKFLLLLNLDDIEPWMIWGYYISPMMYGQNAIVINEFLENRWSAVRYPRKFANNHCVPLNYLHLIIFNFTLLQPNPDPSIPEPTVGKVLLRSRGMFKEEYWYWISVGALLAFSVLFNICFIVALTILNRKQSLTTLISSSVTAMRFWSWHCFENQMQL